MYREYVGDLRDHDTVSIGSTSKALFDLRDIYNR